MGCFLSVSFPFHPTLLPLSIDMLGISAALAVFHEPRKPLLPLGVIFIVLTWGVLIARFVRLLQGGAEGQGVLPNNGTEDGAASLLDDVVNATVPAILGGNSTVV